MASPRLLVESPGGCETGGGSSVDFGSTLTGKLQWGHSTLWRALLSSTEMVWAHQGQAKWIAIPRIQSHSAERGKACRIDDGVASAGPVRTARNVAKNTAITAKTSRTAW